MTDTPNILELVNKVERLCAQGIPLRPFKNGELELILTDWRRQREALKEAIEFASQDHHALTPTGEEMLERWRLALGEQ